MDSELFETAQKIVRGRSPTDGNRMLAEAGNGSGVGSTRAGNTGEKELVKNPDGTMEFSGTGNSVKSPKPSSLSDVEARRWYLDSEAKIPEMIDKTQSLEQQAQQASTLRNQFRTQARNAMSNRDGADALFGSNPNMTWEQVVEKYTNRGYSGDELYQEIINASQKSNAGVNSSLGIEP